MIANNDVAIAIAFVIVHGCGDMPPATLIDRLQLQPVVLEWQAKGSTLRDIQAKLSDAGHKISLGAIQKFLSNERKARQDARTAADSDAGWREAAARVTVAASMAAEVNRDLEAINLARDTLMEMLQKRAYRSYDAKGGGFLWVPMTPFDVIQCADKLTSIVCRRNKLTGGRPLTDEEREDTETILGMKLRSVSVAIFGEFNKPRSARELLPTQDTQALEVVDVDP